MRAILIVLDGVGIGNAPDAGHYNDLGADTLGHLQSTVRDLELPTLFSLGLGEVLKGRVFDPPARRCAGCYGRMRQRSVGKDATVGHWELAGIVNDQPFVNFDHFPDELVAEIACEAKVGFLGNSARSTAAALQEWGQEHFKTGKPILYNSASSVMSIAAHEKVIPRGRLYEICRVARRKSEPYRVGHVIARPFTGKPNAWTPVEGRHDYAMVPPRTVLNAISEMGLPVEGIGKVSDIFAQSGITRSHSTASDAEGFKLIEQIWRSPQNGFIFANLADFDSAGHRRDPEGCARALERFDDWLADFLEEIETDDLLIVTGDHGNDPTFHGIHHTREEVPVLLRYDGRTGPLGVRETFADVAATLAAFFGLNRGDEPWTRGNPLITFHRPEGFPVPR